MPSSLLLELPAALKRVADPAKATQMQAYMKSKLPYLGIQAPLLSRTGKLFFAAHPLNSAAAWRKAVLEIWRSAQFREERYAAIELTGAKRYAAFQTLQTLPMYEELVVTGALVGLRRRDCFASIGPIAQAVSDRDAAENAELEPLGEYLEEAKRHPLPALLQS